MAWALWPFFGLRDGAAQTRFEQLGCAAMQCDLLRVLDGPQPVEHSRDIYKLAFRVVLLQPEQGIGVDIPQVYANGGRRQTPFLQR